MSSSPSTKGKEPLLTGDSILSVPPSAASTHTLAFRNPTGFGHCTSTAAPRSRRPPPLLCLSVLGPTSSPGQL